MTAHRTPFFWTVALLAEGVDRNFSGFVAFSIALVALLAEGVDRNYSLPVRCYLLAPVALLAEGVDRNFAVQSTRIHSKVSPSSRRAWIEIDRIWSDKQKLLVALLAEGVDRNVTFPFFVFGEVTSPSSRRAWIEIDHQC